MGRGEGGESEKEREMVSLAVVDYIHSNTQAEDILYTGLYFKNMVIKDISKLVPFSPLYWSCICSLYSEAPG